MTLLLKSKAAPLEVPDGIDPDNRPGEFLSLADALRQRQADRPDFPSRRPRLQ